MIAGKIRDNEIVIRFRVFDSSGTPHEVESVLDTGFSSPLSLPPSLIQSFQLVWQNRGRVVLGDGSECLFDVYEATIEWDGEERLVQVHQSNSDPLIGMALLRGFEVNFKVRQGGKVTIKRLPKK